MKKRQKLVVKKIKGLTFTEGTFMVLILAWVLFIAAAPVWQDLLSPQIRILP